MMKEIFTPGISAGNCMGGEFNEDLPMDFLVDCDMEKFTDEFPMRCYEQILNNSDIAEFKDHRQLFQHILRSLAWI